MEALGGAAVIIWIFLAISGIAALFVPFWVCQIRNRAIKIDKNLEELVRLLSDHQQANNEAQEKPWSPSKITESEKKICPNCDEENIKEAPFCLFCRHEFLD